MSEHHLRNAGLKITAPRLKILALLENAQPHHMSAEAIFQHLKKDQVSLATIYRVLTQFEKSGIIRRHNFEGGFSVFELEHGKHHDHLVCERCGTVKEFFDDTIEKQQLTIAKKNHFIITNHQHTIYGVCSECAKLCL